MKKNVLEKVAANGLINRRHLLGMGLSGMGMAVSNSVLGADAGLEIPNWSKTPGPGPSGYGGPSSHTGLQRLTAFTNPTYPGGGASRSRARFAR